MPTQGPAPNPKCKLNIFHILYTPTFFRLSHLYQEFCVHCIIIMNDGGDRWGVVDSYQSVDGGTGRGY